MSPTVVHIPRTAEKKSLDRAVSVALHYGFQSARNTSLLDPIVTKRPASEKQRDPKTLVRPCFELSAMQKISILPAVVRLGALRRIFIEPYLLYSVVKKNQQATNKKDVTKSTVFTLEALGLPGTIGEAIIIKTALAILEELGEKKVSLSINSLGDRDSILRFLRDSILYYRRYIDTIHPRCRDTFRENPLSVLDCGHDSCRELRTEAPKPIGYLSEPSRRHFKEVLEYLETLAIPYEIQDTLVASRFPYSKTVFEIHRAHNPEVTGIKKIPSMLARGGRYDDFSRKMGARVDIPATGIALELEVDTPQYNENLPSTKPIACFIRIGPEAERKGLMVLEILRRAHILVYQPIGIEKFATQLSIADKLDLPYTFIMGHKEAVEGNVIVRRTDTRSQETVPFSNLPSYIRLLR